MFIMLITRLSMGFIIFRVIIGVYNGVNARPVLSFGILPAVKVELFLMGGDFIAGCHVLEPGVVNRHHAKGPHDYTD